MGAWWFVVTDVGLIMFGYCLGLWVGHRSARSDAET